MRTINKRGKTQRCGAEVIHMTQQDSNLQRGQMITALRRPFNSAFPRLFITRTGKKRTFSSFLKLK